MRDAREIGEHGTAGAKLIRGLSDGSSPLESRAKAPEAAMSTVPVIVGIDAGGSSTRARAMQGDRIVFEGIGGPGHPGTRSMPKLTKAYREALEGCPAADRIAACVAGAGSATRQQEVKEILAGIVPGAQVRVYPDYFATVSANRDADVCVIAGTGSVVCSRGSGGEVHASGGHGWILGDPGSAAWLGRALLARFVENPEVFDDTIGARLLATYDANCPEEIVSHLHSSDFPAAALAKAAPMLSAMASGGEAWALGELRQSMYRLAWVVARHVNRWPVAEQPTVALSGGVWSAAVAVETFTTSLAMVCSRAIVATGPATEPINGAVELARMGGMP